eukprot:NODE_99_length_20465_cov_0.827654.p16 type:complete len:180 gc:universal NODE_99_length_20465_cov_0.827654:9064-9603(+)
MIYILILSIFAKKEEARRCGWQNGNAKCGDDYFCGSNGLCGKKEGFKINCQPAASGYGMCGDDGHCGVFYNKFKKVHRFCGSERVCVLSNKKTGTCEFVDKKSVSKCDSFYSYPGLCPQKKKTPPTVKPKKPKKGKKGGHDGGKHGHKNGGKHDGHKDGGKKNGGKKTGGRKGNGGKGQ